MQQARATKWASEAGWERRLGRHGWEIGFGDKRGKDGRDAGRDLRVWMQEGNGG